MTGDPGLVRETAGMRVGGVRLVGAVATLLAAVAAAPAATAAVTRALNSSAIAAEANVVWNSPQWKDDGSGAMPLGNGA